MPEQIARTILDAFEEHYRHFRAISAAAKGRFERADWAAVREASRRRIDMYDDRVVQTVSELGQRYPETKEESAWPQIKRAYVPLLYDCRQPELAETFFNSVACRVLDRTYYRNEYIFWRPVISTDFIEGNQPTYRCFYPSEAGLRRTLFDIVHSFGLRVPFENLQRDLRHVVRAGRERFPRPRAQHPNFHVQVLTSMFFRNKGGYIVGRIVNGNEETPFAVPVRHAKDGERLTLDALLTAPAQLGTLFSLARAYFMVDTEVPSAYVRFLHTLMPGKPPAELYTALGLHKQGKTIFYRDLFEHLKHSSDRFVVAPGARGMVMMVFTLPSFPYVFKLIRDVFAPPKQTSAAEVKRKYVMVKLHDRVGRMADTLEYSNVALPLDRFAPALAEELLRVCAGCVVQDGDRLVLEHVYIQRRMTPLNLWLQEDNEEQARHGLRELSRAVREMAEANIFAGDLLPKNFGVTRFGRVVFYDYDEICELTEVSVRRLPPPRDDADEYGDAPWFGVGPNDIFPEEFSTFLFGPGRLRQLFLEESGQLLDPAWWNARQEDARAGVQPDLFPYPESERFSVKYGE